MPKIKVSAEEEFISPIQPAKKYVPNWYSKAQSFIGGKPSYVDGKTNAAIKSCVPFMDSYLTGYTAELWCDIQVVQKVTGPELRFSKDLLAPVGSRNPDISHPMPTPNGYDDTHFVWHSPYLIKTPPGYSLLITQPLNQYDLPTFTLSAIVDADKELFPNGRIPFFIKKGFEGVIEKGTPIFQVIPFKRESWESVDSPELRKEADQRSFNVATVMYGWYKKNVWTKKEYN
jgi:hypothetical protein